MPPRRPLGLADRKRLAIIALALASLVAALFFLSRAPASEVPTIEQILSSEDVAAIERVRRIFGSEPDMVLMTIGWAAGEVPHQRLREVEEQLRAIPGVKRTWSSVSRPSLGSGNRVRLDRRARPDLLEPRPGTSVMVIALEPGALRLTRARALSAAIDGVAARLSADGESVHLLGTPQIRVASWEVARDDLAGMLPLLVLVVVAVPLLCFASAGAVFFPLVMAALTTSLCLLAYRAISGPINALAMLLVPIIWSVATLDAMHLYHRVRRMALRPEPVASAVSELRLPCLLTTLTTAGGLVALAMQGDSRLIRSFGLWAAAGTCLAFLLTFSIGGALLRLSAHRRALPRWPTRVVLSLILVSQRRARLVTVGWIALLLASAAFAAGLRVQVRFPDYFAPDQEVTRQLRAMQETLGTDMSPLEIYVEATDEHGRGSVPLASAMLIVAHYVGTIAETRFVLPLDLLAADGLDRGSDAEKRLAELVEDPQVSPWIRFEHAAARLQVHFRSMSFARKREVVQWLRHFDKTMLSHHRLSFGGPAYHFLVAEERGMSGLVISGALTLLVILAALAWMFSTWRVLLAALAGNLAPLLLVAGLMGAASIPWSLAAIPLPVLLFGLAVDDTIHLLWPLRGAAKPNQRLLRKGARRAGPALLATTLVLAGCLATMILSGLQLNRELGLLLPAGLALALLCDLTLVPALLTSSKRRSTRPPR